MMTTTQLKGFLDEKVALYNQKQFIENDPIQIPHQFTLKEDIEIIGFLVATISWGNRKSIIKNGHKLIEILGNSPYDFVMHYSDRSKDKTSSFVHRTFNGIDLDYFLKSLQNIYVRHHGLEKLFRKYSNDDTLQPAIHHFKQVFFELPHPRRTKKHVSDPFKNSAAKRINMFLRWMVRADNAGVDFGIWNSLSPAQLSCPLDVHSGNTARKLELIQRKQNDAKALLELDKSLRELDSKDPVKYDFALFGLGIHEGF